MEVCPILNPKIDETHYERKAFKSWNINAAVRYESSSGGIFSAIAESIINDGGIVYGAGFNSEFKLCHSPAHNNEELYKLRGSKYIQSDLKYAFRDIKQNLKDNIKVFFVGAPCQVDGLKAYLTEKESDNLLTCDFICHGVGSAKVFDLILKYLSNKYSSSVRSINFREKSNGWGNSKFKIRFNNGKIYQRFKSASIFGYAYATCLINGRACGNCKYANMIRKGDLTMADYSGLDLINEKKANLLQGISLVIVNSHKGNKMWTEISNKVVKFELPMESVIKSSRHLAQSSPAHRLRRNFFEELDKLPFDVLINKYLKAPLKIRAIYFVGPQRINKIISFLKKVLSSL
jgi:coenzyme F420-reducing hydrogenase beta subunit